MAAPPGTLLDQIVDDAALFPPGNAPMAQAVASHATHRAAWYADLVGPLVCPASRIDELRSTLPADATLALSLVFDVSGDAAHDALRAVGSDERLTLAAVEAAHARLGDDAATVGENLRRLPGTVGFLEVARTGFDDGLDLVAKGGWRAAKYRTGGVTPEDFPTEGELAAFMIAAAERDLPFKLTAGLHHALRSTTREGYEAHGLLNALVASRVATSGVGGREVAIVLAQRQPAPLVELINGWDESTCGDVRRAFRSVGCCGVTDPIGELAELGLVEEPAA